MRQKRNQTMEPGRGFILDNCLCMSVYWASTGPIISSLTRYFQLSLAASNFISGFTTILPIFQMLGGMAYGRSRKPFRFLLLSGGLWRIFMPLVFLTVLLPHSLGAAVMLLSYLAGMSIYQYSVPPQISWMSGCVAGKVPGNYYARRETLFMAAYTALFCFATLTIDAAERADRAREGFVLIGVVFAVLMFLSALVLFRLPAPAVQPQKSPALSALLLPLRDRHFRPLIYATMAWNFCLMFITGFSPVYQVQALHVSFFQIMVCITIANTVRVFCTSLMGRLAGRIGWKYVTILGTCVIVLAAVLWGFTTRDNYLWRYPVLVLLEGLAFSGLSVGYLELNIASSPEENRSIYVGLVNLAGGISSLVGSILCSGLIGLLEVHAPSAVRYVFFVGAVLCCVCLLLLTRVPYQMKKGESQ